MVANRIAFFFLLPGLCMLYLAWDVNPAYAPGIIPFIVGAVLVYILAPQINWWWYQRWPPDLNKDLTKLLEQFSGYYKRLSPLEKKRFRTRVALFRMSVEWMPKGFQDDLLPPDIETMLAAQAIQLTFGKENYLFPQFEKVIIYPFPFPTPEYPFPHNSELYEADGCLLFSAQQVAKAFIQPHLYYNVALHEYVRVYMHAYPKESYPDTSNPEIWQKMEQISNLERANIESSIGLAGVDALAVLIHHYFTFPDRFNTILPEECHILNEIFQQSPFPSEILAIHAA